MTARLLTWPEVQALPMPEWQIEGYLPLGGLAELFSPPGVAKTFLGLEWSLDTGLGRRWFGRAVKPGTVAYIATEGAAGLRARIEGWDAAHGIDGTPHVLFRLEALPLAEPIEVAAFVSDVKTMSPSTPRLIVLDTWHGCTVGLDENSARDMGVALEACRYMQRETGAAVLILHHAQKSGTGIEDRGSSAIGAAMDARFALSEDDGVITLKCVKQKDGPQSDPLALRLAPSGPSCVLVPDSGQTPGTMTPSQRDALKALHLLGGEANTKDWEAASRLKLRTLHAAREHLTTMRFVESPRRGRHALTDSGKVQVQTMCNGSATAQSEVLQVQGALYKAPALHFGRESVA